MSGGVDSSVAALRALEAGHDVTGVTLRLWGGTSDRGCCSVADVEDAARVAAQLGIAHHVFNLSDEFEAFVVEPYVEAHRRGTTPNPCIECNRHLKFDLLLESAHRLGFDLLATGHHARVVATGGARQLRRGVDVAKDQSYVLSMLTPRQIDRLVLPVGDMTKAQVREVASAAGLATSTKAESQDTCFIESSGGRRRFLGERLELHPGSLIEVETGRKVGEVAEIELVTVGQRRGLGLDDEGRRRVVVDVDVAQRAVLVADPDGATTSVIDLDPTTVTSTSGTPLPVGTAILVQLRSHAVPHVGTYLGTSIDLDEPSAPVAPGQTAAFYSVDDPDLVLGSGIVAR
jgi:tRNA-specific 2-thiouridylase